MLLVVCWLLFVVGLLLLFHRCFVSRCLSFVLAVCRLLCALCVISVRGVVRVACLAVFVVCWFVYIVCCGLFVVCCV